MWQLLEPQVESVRQPGRAFGCDPEEMAITRNAERGAGDLQLGLDLKPGDEILTTNQDYPRMITAWRQRERRDGVVLKTYRFPVPPEPETTSSSASRRPSRRGRASSSSATSRTSPGQILPIRSVLRMARERGSR